MQKILLVYMLAMLIIAGCSTAKNAKEKIQNPETNPGGKEQETFLPMQLLQPQRSVARDGLSGRYSR